MKYHNVNVNFRDLDFNYQWFTVVQLCAGPKSCSIGWTHFLAG